MSAAAHVAKVRVASPRIAGVAMEPRAVLAAFDASTEELTLWVSCQAPFRIRAEVARLLGLAESRVRVIAPDVGGGFGVKSGPYREEILLAWLAVTLGRPVKWIATRGEDQITTNHARGSACDAELGVDADGRITGLRARITSPLGTALMNGAAGPPWNHARLLPGCYVVPACDISVTGALTTTTPVAAYRGAGRPEATYVIERLMDEAARGLGLDPAEIRRRNFIAAGAFPYRTATGQVYDSGDYHLALDKALEAADYAGLRREQAERRKRGRDRGHRPRVLRRALRARLGERQPQGRALGPRHRHHGLERARAGTRDDVRPDRRRSSRRHARRGRGASRRHALRPGGLRHVRQPQRGPRRQRAGPRVGGAARQGPAHRGQAARGRAGRYRRRCRAAFTWPDCPTAA